VRQIAIWAVAPDPAATGTGTTTTTRPRADLARFCAENGYEPGDAVWAELPAREAFCLGAHPAPPDAETG
jgi:hypothetical protein